MPKINN